MKRTHWGLTDPGNTGETVSVSPDAASRRCVGSRRNGVCLFQLIVPPPRSELNPLATHAPWGLMQRLSPLHECGGAEMPPHWWTRFAAPTERTRDRDAFQICIMFVQQQNEEQKL